MVYDVIFVNFFVLGYVGMMPAEGLYLLIAKIGLVLLFCFYINFNTFNWKI